MRRAHILELDGVRGLACMLVIFLHVVIAPIPEMPGTWFDLVRFRIQPFMSGGVDLFFILSGILISGALMDSKGKPNFFRSFWLRRIARIFPVFYLMILVSILCRYLYEIGPTPALHALTNLSLPEWYYAIFSQNIVMAFTKTSGNNILAVTWSLAIEEQFYLVFPFLVFFLPRRMVVATALFVIAATPVIRALVVNHTNWSAGYLLTISRMDALMLGVTVAAIVRHPLALSRFRQWRLFLNGLAVVLLVLQAFDFWGASGEAWRLSASGKFFYLVLVCVQYPLLNIAMALLLLNIFSEEENAVRRFLRTKVLISLGLISYGAYMYHQSINWALWAWLYGDDPKMTTLAQGYLPLLVLAVTVGVSWVSYRYFEMPVRRWIGGLARSRPKETPFSRHDRSSVAPAWRRNATRD